MPQVSPYAAVFIDFENIYYFIKNHFHDPADLDDYVLKIVRGLRDNLAQQGLDCLVMNAYADFERILTAPQGNLYLLGVSTRNVLGTDHKNAADMQLCIDALEVLYTRPDIGTFILVAGDRDYIPVIQHLRRQARQVRVVGFRESVSGDLIQNLGKQHFINARDLLGRDTMILLDARRLERQQKEAAERRQQEAEQKEAEAAEATIGLAGIPELDVETIPFTAVKGIPARIVLPKPLAKKYPLYTEEPREEAPEFAPISTISSDLERRVLALILDEISKLEQRQHRAIRELWLGPFMRLLTDELTELPDYERRDLINGLRDAGAIRVEKRRGEPHDFSVIVVNYSHPEVWELNPSGEDPDKV